MGNLSSRSLFPDKFFQYYKLGKVVKSFEFVKLFKCKDIAKKTTLMVKLMYLNSKKPKALREELIRMMLSFDHPSIMKTYSYFPNHLSECLVTE